MRIAAFLHVEKLAEQHGLLPYNELCLGFQFEGKRICLLDRRRGIFKPKAMRYLLSIKTVTHKPGHPTQYEDQLHAHEQIFNNKETINYSFMKKKPNARKNKLLLEARENQLLLEACENQIPLIYFLRITSGRYLAIIPAHIIDWDSAARKSTVAFGIPDANEYSAPSNTEWRNYGLQTVQRRLHQAKFREAVITAYSGHCAISGLPVQRLLDAAHIISDRNEELGQPVVPNGLLLAKTHHAAFDAHMIGIDPDCRLHVAERLLARNNGPMLEMLKQLRGKKLRLPRYKKNRPDPTRLEQRFAEFKAAEEFPATS